MQGKLEELQKDFYELNNMFSLVTITSQSNNIEDFLNKVSNFISLQSAIHNISFYIKDEQYFKGVQTKQNTEEKFIDLQDETDAFWSTIDENKITPIIENQVRFFEGFFAKHNINNKDLTHVRIISEGGEKLALCFIGKNENEADLSEKDIDFLNKVFNYINPIIAKLIHSKERDKRITDLQKTLCNISILYNVSQAVNFIDDLKRLLQVILSKALMTLDAEKGSLMLYDYSENALQVKVVHGLSDDKVENDINNGLTQCAKIKAGEGVAGLVFLEKKPIITNLGSNDPRFIKFGSIATTDSLLCVPLTAKGEAIGVINISNKKNGKLFNQQDLEFMSALASQAAIAIDNAKLYELATKDGLTKLYIYRHFYTLLENEIRRCHRYRHNMSLLMMDIDNFKLINDNHGHLLGDQILRELSTRITQMIRKIDTPARYGGEEFAIILPETSIMEASIIAERLRISINNICVESKDGSKVSPSISIGIAQFPDQAQDGETLIGNADIALYYAKEHGKNMVCLYDEKGCKPLNQINSEIENFQS